VINKFCGLRQTADTYCAEVRLFNYQTKEDALKPLWSITRNMVDHFF